MTTPIPANPVAAGITSSQPDAYYRKLCSHARISQSNTSLPEAFSSIGDTGRWHNSGSEPVETRTLFLDFQSLHHMNVIHIQDQLAKECNEIIRSKTTSSGQLDRVKVLLKDHCKNSSNGFCSSWLIPCLVADAIRNWDATIARPIAAHRFGPNETWRAESTYRFLAYWDNPMTTRVGARFQRILRRKNVQQLGQRFIMAISGGVALLVPMIVMVLNPSQNKSLITTCVAVSVFAIIIALISKASPENVLGITAAYAAVLVVFVGTGSSGPS